MTTPPRSTRAVVLSSALSIGLRVVAFVALYWAFVLLGPWLFPWDDDGMYTGFVFGLVSVALAGLWGTADGLRFGYARVAVVWVVTGVLSGLEQAASPSIGHGPVDGSVLRSDLLQLTPFMAMLLIVPALAGGAISALASVLRVRLLS